MPRQPWRVGENAKKYQMADILLQEIRDLGGDVQDLELVRDIDSDQEVDCSEVDGACLADIQNFIGTLDFSAANADATIESESEDVESVTPESDVDDTPPVRQQVRNEEIDLMFSPTGAWYQVELPALKYLVSPLSAKKLKAIVQRKEQKGAVVQQSTMIKLLHEYAQQLRAEESRKYMAHKHRSSPSDAAFLSQIVKKGTSADKVSAMSLSVQESPIHFLQFVDQLMQSIQTDGTGDIVLGKRREVERAIDILHELFKETMLPHDRKLKFFGEQAVVKDVAQHLVARVYAQDVKQSSVDKLPKLIESMSQPEQVKAHLLYYYVEDTIKAKYYTFIMALNLYSTVSSAQAATAGNTPQRILNHMYELLVNVPEQESTLLAMLVSKFGVNNRVLASKAVNLLSVLVTYDVHPQMKMVVVRAVEHFLNQTAPVKRVNPAIKAAGGKAAVQKVHEDDAERVARGKFYALVYLSQMVLSTEQADVECSRHLVHLYLKRFEGLIVQVEGEREQPKDKDLANKSSHAKRPNARNKKRGLPANADDDVQVTVESKMMSAILTGLRRAMPFALCKLPGDTDTTDFAEVLVKKHMDQLFRLMHSTNVTMMSSAQCFQIVLQILYRPKKDNNNPHAVDDSSAVLMPQLTSRFYRALYSSLHSDRHQACQKHHAIYLNVLFKSMLHDASELRTLAFIRRILQVCTTGSFSTDNAFICGALVTIGAVITSRPEIKALCTRVLGSDGRQSASTQSSDEVAVLDDDEDEHFVDRDEAGKAVDTTQTTDAASTDVRPAKIAYDHMQRTPEYCCPDKLPLHEMAPLLTHYHPTVRLFAETFVRGQPLNYPSDPLQDFVLMRFLDRFVYKNPKLASADGDRQKERAKMSQRSGTSSVLRQPVQMDRTAAAPVNSAQWRQRHLLPNGNIPADERFYQTYFRSALDGGKSVLKTVKEGADDLESEKSMDDADIMDAINADNDRVNGVMSDGEDDASVDFGSDFDGDEDEEDYASEMEQDEEQYTDDEDEDVDALFGDFADDQEPSRKKRKTDKKKFNSGISSAIRALSSQKKDSTTFASIDDYAHLIDKDEDFAQ